MRHGLPGDAPPSGALALGDQLVHGAGAVAGDPAPHLTAR